MAKRPQETPQSTQQGAPAKDAGQPQAKQSQQPNRSPLDRQAAGALTVLGIALGCILAWVSMNFQSLNMLSDAGEPILDRVYLLSNVLVMLTFLSVGIFYRQVSRPLALFPVRLALAVCTAVSTALLYAAGQTGGLVPLEIASSVLSGIASGLFVLCFGLVVSQLSSVANIVVVVAVGCTAMSALTFVFTLFGQLESTVFAASMPFASLALAELAGTMLRAQGNCASSPLPPQGPPTDENERRDVRHLTIAIAAATVLAGFSNELARTLYVQMGIAGSGSHAYAVLQAGVGLIVTVGAVGLTLALATAKSPHAPAYCYRLIVLFLALGSMLLPLPLLMPAIPVAIPYALNGAACQCFGLMAWVLVCGMCSRHQGSVVRSFSFVRAGWACGPLLGMLAGRAIVHGPGIDITSLYLAALAGTVVVLLAGSFAFTENDLARALNILPLERRRRFVEKCDRTIERFGLTEREGEIMTLFAKGRNLAYIQEQLCLSRNTVSTHRQHIYQKLGVHSQQEMIDLIQGMDG